jgi:hypothetical protein
MTISDSSTSYSCMNGGSTSTCLYTTDLAPEVTIIAIATTEVTFTGSGFQITDYDQASASINGVSANSVIINSDTEVVATFDSGSPIAEDGSTPVLSFSSSDYETDFVIHYATMSSTYDNEFSVSSATSPSCSFAGGCDLDILGTDGIQSAMEGGYLSVTVCGEACEINSDTSSEDHIICSLPGVSTIYSEETLSLSTKTSITGSNNFADTEDGEEESVWDEDNQSIYESENAECWIGT